MAEPVDAGDLKVGFFSLTCYEPDGIAGVAELVDATDLNRIECSRGNARCRTAQIRGTLSDGDPEPSLNVKASRKV